MKIEYKIYNPSGNITALVIGDDYNLKERKLINDKIMKNNKKVEQVGFVSKENKKLTMAGGEFCGNATRCAVLHYINIKKQESIELEINNQKLKAGIDENKNIWCEMPIEEYKINELDKNIYKILLKGITIVVIRHSKNYKNLKQRAKNLIKNYNIEDNAVGVMFIKRENEQIKMYPIVWVREIDTLFFENACGSGTIAVAMLETFLSQESNNYCIMQPSKECLETEIIFENNRITKAILKGKIKTDNKINESII